MCNRNYSNNINNFQPNASCSSSLNRTVYGQNGYENYSYANSYVPNQVLGVPFAPMQGLQNGTMFPELIRPYYPGQSLEQMNYLRYGRGGYMY